MKKLQCSISTGGFTRGASWLLVGVLLISISLNAGCPADIKHINVFLSGAPEEMTVGDEVTLQLSQETSSTHRLTLQTVTVSVSTVAVLVNDDNGVECGSILNDDPFDLQPDECSSLSAQLMTLTLRALGAGIVRVTYQGCADTLSGGGSGCPEKDSAFVDIRVVNPGDELCGNNADDDGNGLVDCADPACTDFSSCPPSMDSACNPECGFDNTGPDESRAGAICDIMFPNETNDGTTGQSCDSDADCEDGNDCTDDQCVGAFVFVCQNMPIDGCEGPPEVRNGDTIVFDFDHTIVTLTVNGQSAELDFSTGTWIASELPAGTQTLRIEWQNRPGANPPNGCHEIEVLVVP